MESYKGWPLLETLPDGWRIDATAGSPLHGYAFAINGESFLSPLRERALVRTINPQRHLPLVEPRKIKEDSGEAPRPSPPAEIDPIYARTANELARKKFTEKILLDVLVDLTICEIEGWNKLEYLDELKSLINGIGRRSGVMPNALS